MTNIIRNGEKPIMSAKLRREIYFSFFMFTADLRPDDTRYTQILIDHLKALTDMGYDGFDLHIASPAATSTISSRSTATSA
jgi:hypothetical protein